MNPKLHFGGWDFTKQPTQGPVADPKGKPHSINTGAGFTVPGIIIMAVLFWLAGVNGSPELKRTINMFLFVLLMSIILLRWDVIRPLILK